MNILLCSAGRRPYLARWFQDVATKHNHSVSVIVADADEFAPSKAYADHFVLAPPIVDPSYVGWLAETLERFNIDIALSVNDFEISMWALEIPRADEFNAIWRLSSSIQETIEDKFQMASSLQDSGIRTPDTVLASDREGLSRVSQNFVVKGRYGSGSRGLGFSDLLGIDDAVARAIDSVTDQKGRRPRSSSEAADFTVVQPLVTGTEYGLDIVNDRFGKFLGVLARRKIAMRAGETDKAITVDPEPFLPVGEKLSQFMSHKGLVDVDVIVDEDDETWVIDVNPRFGGGYPFNHVAGANVPLALLFGSEMGTAAQLLNYDWNIVGSKFVDTVPVNNSHSID